MTPSFLAAAVVDLQPLWVLVAGVAFVVTGIAWLRIPPFFALLLAATGVGLLSRRLPGDEAAGASHWLNALNLPMSEMGKTCASIALPIALAAVIGACMMHSGAADRIVLSLLKSLGEKRAALALLASGFLLSIPVFFDTVFFLLVPLAAALALRTGRHFMLFILAICGGAVLTHSLVPPTPGPIVMAENLHIDLGFIILVGLGTALLPAALTLFLAGWIDRRFPMPVPASLGGKSQESEQLPNVALSVLPILLPVVLIAGASVYKASGSLGIGMGEWIAFLGHKNTAMFLGALCAVALVLREGRDGISKLLDGPFQTAGMIILITSAGGAFGAMIKHSGVPETVLALVGGASVNFVLLGWAVSAVLKIAQGSGTVAMIVTSEMMAGMIDDPSALPYHPVYIALAIGFGSFSLSWMNDSAFWIVGRLCGFNEKQTLQSWTLLLSLLSVFGLLLMLGASSLMPLR